MWSTSSNSYTQQHYVCILDHSGQTNCQKNKKVTQEKLISYNLAIFLRGIVWIPSIVDGESQGTSDDD